ncbi:putative inositol phospholipid biosynthesis protein Scs3 [Talaromyces proteolyticus]|uniref:Acyl-coenzyme A diphosphatase SCS3 n=1 Tax=Talaromyces proteolyticus TaxID=1131652 RepID=A0AAD4KK23_9EURO|nr:putative inositol phospholipid biosynthesis protein Scs3 [Talaromyces proteolyticus]KAH8692818.1 putative inositol phospholipid biosynthesis protein Scs3 [Talaromyces proteolyticus]
MATATTPLRSTSPPQFKGSRRPRLPPALALIIYPITLVVGSIYSVVSPTARHPRTFETASPLTPSLASDLNLSTEPHPSPVNYFARKNNIFNLYFVKIGWVWITVTFLALLLTQPTYTKAPSGLRSKRTAHALVRYSIVTAAWFLTTQWFFGPAVIDRTFVLTGGKCDNLPPVRASPDTWEELKVILTAAACKAAGGAWKGGHDVSGHVFMLVLGSAFLVFEAVGASRCYLGAAAGADGKAKDDEGEEQTTIDDTTINPLPALALRFAWVVAGLSWWMLFMTAIFFHTWLEKLSGLVISLAVIYVTYLLPQSLLPWRNIVGIPGL